MQDPVEQLTVDAVDALNAVYALAQQPVYPFRAVRQFEPEHAEPGRYALAVIRFTIGGHAVTLHRRAVHARHTLDARGNAI